MINGLFNSNTDNMKRLFTSILFTCMAMSMVAQGTWGSNSADSTKCFENFNDFGALYNSKSYLDAYDHWKVVYEICPAASVVIYKYAPKLFAYKIKDTQDSAMRAGLVSDLMSVYDNQMTLYPGTEAKLTAKKANDHFKYNKDYNEAYVMFNDALQLDPSEVQPSYLNTYFKVVLWMYKNDSIDAEGLLNSYAAVSEAIQLQSIRLNKEVRMLTEKDTLGTISSREQRILSIDNRILGQASTLISNIEKGLAPVLTCDRMNLIYNEEAFEAHQTDATWLRRALKMLGKEREDSTGTSDCSDNPMYYLAAQALYDMVPSAQAARSMGLLSLKNEKWSEALTYYQSAIDQEADPLLQAKDYLRLAFAHKQIGSLPSAKTACLGALNADPSFGKPLLFLAQIYAESAGTCGNNAFEKNAVYWAAIDKLYHAKRIDESLTVTADKMISAYRVGIPDKSISFQFGHLDGERYRITCWINETVTVRF